MSDLPAHDLIFCILRPMLLTGLLFPVCVTDIRRRTIGNGWCIAIGSCGLLLFAVEAFLARPDWIPVLTSAGAGVLAATLLCLLCRLVSKEGFGMGDVKLVLAMGLFLGIDRFLRAMALTGALTLIGALWLLLVRHANKTETLPLAPFLTAGALLASLGDIAGIL